MPTQAADEFRHATTVLQRGQILIKECLTRPTRIAALGIRRKHPVSKVLCFLVGQLVVAPVPVVAKSDDDEGGREKSWTINGNVGLEKIEREIQPGAALFPAFLKPGESQVAKGRYSRGSSETLR